MSEAAALFEPLWDVKRAAEYLGMSVKWVYANAANGTLPCTKIGGALRFVPGQLRAYALGERSLGESRPAAPFRRA